MQPSKEAISNALHIAGSILTKPGKSLHTGGSAKQSYLGPGAGWALRGRESAPSTPAQVLINALTGDVGPGTQRTGNPTYQELRYAPRVAHTQIVGTLRCESSGK